MSDIRSVYIVEPDDQGWIIERLMRDLAAELASRGIPARIGKGGEYDGEDVVFNSRFMTALHDPRARVNSLFITHVDDRIKELELRQNLTRFQSFVCLSPHDAEFVAALKGDWHGVVGIDLPARDLRVRPVRVALFSACYPDGRKNEQWIADYFRDKPPEVRGAFVFCFLGWGWESFCAQLALLEMNYEIYRYSRYVPGEYEMYKSVLAGADCLIYPGFDGGAMSVYDALSAGLPVIASDTSYHRDLGSNVRLFADRPHFFAELDRLYSQHASRVEALRARSVSAYTTRLLNHWNELVDGGPGGRAHSSSVPAQSVGAREQQTLQSFRENYKHISFTRVRSAAIRWLQTRLIRS